MANYLRQRINLESIFDERIGPLTFRFPFGIFNGVVLPLIPFTDQHRSVSIGEEGLGSALVKNMTQLPTKRQKQLLNFIGKFIEKRGYSPTYQEMADALDVNSPATIFDHLQELSRKGFVKVYAGAVRGIEILNSSLASNLSPLNVELPLLGYIAAGQPIEVVTQTETVLVSSSLISGKRKSFVLRVKGDSMIDEGILDGDYVVIEERDVAADGEIVVALLPEGLATLKKFYKEKTRIRLEPANSKMAPIYAPSVQIQGKVVGIVRRFH